MPPRAISLWKVMCLRCGCDMNWLSYLIMFLSASKVCLACECTYSTRTEDFLKAAFVAEVIVDSVYYSDSTNDYKTHRIDISTIRIFKGRDPEWVQVYGFVEPPNYTGRYIGSSCDLRLRKNQRLIIFAYQSGDILATGQCSGNFYYTEEPSTLFHHDSEYSNLLRDGLIALTIVDQDKSFQFDRCYDSIDKIDQDLLKKEVGKTAVYLCKLDKIDGLIITAPTSDFSAALDKQFQKHLLSTCLEGIQFKPKLFLIQTRYSERHEVTEVLINP